MAEYYAITGHEQVSWYTPQGQQVYGLGWYVLAGPMATKAEAADAGRASIGDVILNNSTDTLRKTQQQNMIVVSKSALKKYHLIDEVGV